MLGIPHTTSRSVLKACLFNSFVEGVIWPVEPAALAALIDMGLSDNQIATYFSVDLAEVHAVCERYLLNGSSLDQKQPYA
jgi:hypothetical protein